MHAKEFDNINTDAIINEYILKNNWRRSKFSMYLFVNVCHIII